MAIERRVEGETDCAAKFRSLFLIKSCNQLAMSDSESQDDTEACSESVDDLLAGLDQFDLTFLKPLLEKPLSETMSSLGGEIEKSKLLVNIGYVLLNLIWSLSPHLLPLSTALGIDAPGVVIVYLRTKGIDPDSHPVIPELERIKSYFSKVKHAENPEKRPSPSTLTVLTPPPPLVDP